MNFKIILSVGLFALAASAGFAQNQSNGAISGTITPSLLPPGNTEAFRFRPGLITQLDAGSGFDFTTASQWSSLGRLSTSNQTLYGLRVQRAGRGLVFGYSGAPQGTTPTLGTPVIQWVGDSGVTAGDLLFRTSASSSSTISSNVLKLRENATALLAFTSKYEDNSILTYPGYNSDRDFYPSPKLEINYTEYEGLAVITDNATNEFGRAAIFNNRNSFANGVSIGSASYATTTGGGSNSLTIGAVAWGQSTVLGIGPVYGVSAQARNGRTNYGVYSVATSASSLGNNYGVYANVNGSSGAGSINYGVYGAASGNNAFAGYFAGRIFSTNNLVVSDKSLKTDINKDEKVLEKITSLNPVNYMFIKKPQDVNLNLPEKLQHGFIAQELEEIFPELVEEVTHPVFNEKGEQTGTKTLKSVNYTGLISVLTQSIIELKQEINVLNEKIAASEKTYVVNDTKGLTSEQIAGVVANGYYMGQNTPNPFSESTTIKYSLPENEKNAAIWIMNLSGQTIKEYKLEQKEGSITINSGMLQKGIYLYGLISNGQEIISKKMIVN